MIKPIFILIFGLLLFQTAKAQKDSALFYMKGGELTGRIVETKDSADYLLLIRRHPDSSTERKIAIIKEFTIDNKAILTGSAIVHIMENFVYLNLVGATVNFYPNGQRASVVNYKDQRKIGERIDYYPNGQLYTKKIYRNDDDFDLIECRDSTGNVLSKNGNGKWVKYSSDYRNKIEEGFVKDSLEEGEWRGFINDTAKYTRVYHKGNIVAADTSDTVYMVADQLPEFTGGSDVMRQFLGQHIRYPAEARAKHAQGRIYISVVVEKDGSLTNIKAIRGAEVSLKEEAVRVVKLLPPWQPGLIKGKPVRIQVVFPISFQLGV